VTEESEHVGTETGTRSEAGASKPRSPRSLPDHPVRIALLDLLAELGTVTSTQAAARLGYSSGLCSFHLRQLARHGIVEEAPRHGGGRVRPWRLRWDDPRRPAATERTVSAALLLTQDEADELAAAFRALVAPYEHRGGHPEGATPWTLDATFRPTP
jgi:predicted ArsR family transcriptional regulator